MAARTSTVAAVFLLLISTAIGFAQAKELKVLGKHTKPAADLKKDVPIVLKPETDKDGHPFVTFTTEGNNGSEIIGTFGPSISLRTNNDGKEWPKFVFPKEGTPPEPAVSDSATSNEGKLRVIITCYNPAAKSKDPKNPLPKGGSIQIDTTVIDIDEATQTKILKFLDQNKVTVTPTKTAK